MDTESTLVENLIGCGKYQAWHFLLFQWITILQACNIAFMAFGKYLPHFECDSTCVKEAINGYQELNDSGDYENDIWKCLNSTRVVQFQSIAIEWRLYCAKEKYSYFILTSQMLGILIGSLVFGQLSDFYGRKKVLFMTVFCQIVCGTVSAYSHSWRVFIVFRFFIGFFGGGTQTANQVYFAEVVNAKHRLWMSNIGGWPFGMGIFVIIAWITKDWRTLSLYSNLMCIPTILLLWHLDESPRWRLQHGHHEKAERTLRKFMKSQYAWKKDSEKLTQDLRILTKTVSAKSAGSDDQAQNEQARYTYLHLFSSTAMRNFALVVALTHFSSSCIAHGIMFHADALSGDIYVNLFLLSAFRWLMNLATILVNLCLKCGRKHIFIIPCLAIALCSTVVILYGSHAHYTSTVTALTLTAGALSSPLWISTLLWPAELFPTPVRSLASSFGAVFDRLAGVVISQILLTAKIWPTAPYIVFAFLSITAALAVGFILPETKGHPLPERMPRQIDGNPWETVELVKESSDEGNSSSA